MYQGFQGYGFHVSTNPFEILRELLGLDIFVVCLRAMHIQQGRFLSSHRGPLQQYPSTSIFGVP